MCPNSYKEDQFSLASNAKLQIFFLAKDLLKLLTIALDLVLWRLMEYTVIIFTYWGV